MASRKNETVTQKELDKNMNQEGIGGSTEPGPNVLDTRPTQEDLTRAIRQEVLKEVSHLLNEKYDVELDEEDRKQLSGEV